MLKISNFDYASWIRRHRRNVAIPLLLLTVLLAHYDPRYLDLSLLFVLGGELLRIWAAGHLQKEQKLTTGGPYRFARNPLYIGSFLIANGFCLIAGSLWLWLIVWAYFLCCYLPVIRYEEGILKAKFPGEFGRYSRRVPAFLPAVRPYRDVTTKFSLRQLLKNREYNAVLGIAVAYAYFIFIRSLSNLVAIFYSL